MNENKHITAYTFSLFWQKFHESNKVRKIDRSRCEKLWDACNFSDRKKDAIQHINKVYYDNAYEYLTYYLK